MKQVNKKEPKGPFEWELVILGCSFCGGLWKFESKEESEEHVEMIGLGSFAYIIDCPRCKKKIGMDCHPLMPHDDALFRYIHELEQKLLAKPNG